MSRRTPAFYWDTSVFLAVLKGEAARGASFDAAVELLRRVEAGEAVIVTSEVMVAEVVPFHYTPEKLADFRKWLGREHLVVRGVDRAVSRAAADLRGGCLRRGVHCPKLADALHIATALLHRHQVDAVHAFDDHFPRVLAGVDVGLVAVEPALPVLEQPSLPGAEVDPDA
ncbi:MAG: type II toxin-antitoxin system VapC family toxin [Armatimonadetes bacterium]|nr:type II toxin-antitoxin system VapC family toxin [Armatimonadota bacterium]